VFCGVSLVVERFKRRLKAGNFCNLGDGGIARNKNQSAGSAIKAVRINGDTNERDDRKDTKFYRPSSARKAAWSASDASSSVRCCTNVHEIFWHSFFNFSW